MDGKEKIRELASSYSSLKIATICSHSALQMFHGARAEKIPTIGICTKEREEFYKSFPAAAPDEFIIVDSYEDIPVEELVEEEAVVVPHGSFVEYVGEKLDGVEVPIFGNRGSLRYERSRTKMFEWLWKAGLRTPRILKPEEIDGPAIVKFPGARGGRGYPVVNSYEEYEEKIKDKEGVMIQEFLIGVRAYPHFFHTAFGDAGYKTSYGRVELMGIDRRLETNADEIARQLSIGAKTQISFHVMGNEPMVLRESLLPEIMEMGRKVCESSKGLFGGMHGPFCIETIITEDLEVYAFEISARIVAGTNLLSSPYSEFSHGEQVSTGRRIAIELKEAFEKKRLHEIVY